MRGDVTLVAAVAAQTRVVGEKMGSGDKIFLGDEISTGPNSGMQVMLLDETIFTIGPNAGLVIDEFVYDPATNAGQVTASVVKGAFRFVSGKVAKEEPSKMNVKTPVGTIGIRGTSAAGVVTLPEPGDPNGTISGTFVLLGPGADNNAGERAGRILITNGGTTVEITRSGFGTIISSPDVPPGTPVRLEPAQVAALTAALGTDGSARPNNDNDGQGEGQNGQSGGGNQNQGGDQQAGTGQGSGSSGGGTTGAGSSGLGQATNLAGQNLGEGVTNANLLGQIAGTQSSANDETFEAAEDSGTTSNVNTAVATFDQLRSVTTGTATFNFGTIPLLYAGGAHTDSGGSFDAQAFIDFGAQTLDLQIANIQYEFDQGRQRKQRFPDRRRRPTDVCVHAGRGRPVRQHDLPKRQRIRFRDLGLPGRHGQLLDPADRRVARRHLCVDSQRH